jgi:hypothetical protein
MFCLPLLIFLFDPLIWWLMWLTSSPLIHIQWTYQRSASFPEAPTYLPMVSGNTKTDFSLGRPLTKTHRSCSWQWTLSLLVIIWSKHSYLGCVTSGKYDWSRHLPPLWSLRVCRLTLVWDSHLPYMLSKLFLAMFVIHCKNTYPCQTFLYASIISWKHMKLAKLGFHSLSATPKC